MLALIEWQPTKNNNTKWTKKIIELPKQHIVIIKWKVKKYKTQATTEMDPF